MQLGDSKSIRNAVAAITAALLGTAGGVAAESARLESSLLIYSETDRITVGEGVLGLNKELKGGRTLNLRLTLDALSGASPNGATPAQSVQTFTRPSGNGSYQIAPNTMPLDDTFQDQRYAADVGLTQPWGRLTSLSFGGHISGEHDYSSFGANFGITHDLNRRNTTIGISGAYSHDFVSPVGGAPQAFTALSTTTGGGGEHEGGDDEGGEGGRSESKDVLDLIVGLNQVIDRQTMLRLNYSLNHSSGYLNDPYKFISVVQAANGENPGAPVDYLYESRPASRTKHAVYAELRRHISGTTADLSYRYFWDDWGITANTVEAFYRFGVGGGHALQPHVRWYHQTAADFHRYYLVSGQQFPEHASADSRLAQFDGLTLGLKYILPLDERTDLNLAAEYYSQSGVRGPPDPVGILSQYDLFPKLDALMLRIGFTRDF
ncbi:MAG: DUF3570 domain-containing protein [bacterium]